MDNYKERINSPRNLSYDVVKGVNLIRRIRVAQTIGWGNHHTHLVDQLEYCIGKMFEEVGD